MMNTTRDSETHRLIAGSLCLDFANTLHGHRGLPLHEYLWDYRDLVLWSRHADLIDAALADELLRRAEEQPDQAGAAHRAAIDLRELIFRIFSSLATGDPPETSDLDRLFALWLLTLPRRRLVRLAPGYAWSWEAGPHLERPLWPILLSAMELLTSQEAGRVRECHGDGCDWLFLDFSRNHLRRWCSMDPCGNRSKMRRRTARRRLTHPGSGAR